MYRGLLIGAEIYLKGGEHGPGCGFPMCGGDPPASAEAAAFAVAVAFILVLCLTPVCVTSISGSIWRRSCW